MDNEDPRRGNARVSAGLFVVAIGVILLLNQFGFPFPSWLFKWPTIVMAFGLFVGLRERFRGGAWIVITLIGAFFMFDFIEPSFSLHRFRWPVIIIALGLFMMIRPKRPCTGNGRRWGGEWGSQSNQKEILNRQESPEQLTNRSNDYNRLNYIDSVAIFGSVRKVIVSKDFKGGDLVSVLGGNEVDLSQADINGQAVLDVTTILGGVKLLLPAHWSVKSELVAFFGGIEDKRQLPPGSDNPGKVLVLRGTSIFGGIQVRNY